MSTGDALAVLIVDDEPLARLRLRNLLGECSAPAAVVVAEAGNAVQTMEALRRDRYDLILLDIRMPGIDGLSLARTLREQAHAPAVVFVTAHQEHAVQAFDVEAVDYLTKPVRLERLQTALQKVQRTANIKQSLRANVSTDTLIIQERGRTERVPLAEVLYFKAELKYVTVRTASKSYILDGSLGELEARYGNDFLRIHRNALVARHAMRALERHVDAEEGEGWALRLSAWPELLAVSRRQLAAVREALQSA